jgi:hypothetical protein
MALNLNCFSLGRINADLFPLPVQTFEGDDPVDLGEEGKIFAHPHVFARVNLGAALPY